MATWKLDQGPITLAITNATVVESQKFPGQNQVCFEGASGDRVYIGEMSAMRQLARINLTLETVVGKTIRFEQVKKNGMTYNNLDLVPDGAVVQTGATAAAAARSGPAGSAPLAPQAKVSLEELVALYGQCVGYAIATLGTKCEEVGIPIDGAAIQAGAATLFIRASR